MEGERKWLDLGLAEADRRRHGENVDGHQELGVPDPAVWSHSQAAEGDSFVKHHGEGIQVVE